MKTLISIIQTDLYRIDGCQKNWFGILRKLSNPEFKFLFYLRIANHHYKNRNKLRLLFFRLFLRHYSIKYGYEIPYQCDIQEGFRLMHRGGGDY